MTADLQQLVAEAHASGAEFRLSGADVVINGLGSLPADLQATLQAAAASGALLHYLSGDGGPERAALALLRQLGVTPLLAETAAEGRQAVRDLIRDLRRHGGRLLAIDIETVGTGPRPLVKVNKDGRPALRQPRPTDRTPLDPRLGRMAVMSLYAGGRHVVVLRGVALELVASSRWLRRQALIAFNAGFELSFLTKFNPPPAPCRRQPGSLVCPMQACGLASGVGYNGSGRSLVTAAESHLGIVVGKALAVSDWSAPTLTAGQVAYSSADSVIAFRLWEKLEHRLHAAGTWPAFQLQNAAVAPVVAVEARGLGFDPVEHGRQVRQWERDLLAARQAFRRATSNAVVPSKPAEIAAWLTHVLPRDALRDWPVTPRTGALRTGTGNLKRLVGHVDGARELIDTINLGTLIGGFGSGLLEHVSPVTHRLHPHFIIAAAKSGRFTCNRPNLQQMPSIRAPEFRKCIIARPGYVLIVCDWNQVELRAAAWLSGDPELTDLYERGGDLHKEMAAAILNILIAAVTAEMRQMAKPVSFGSVYGIGPASLAEDAFENYGINMSVDDAAHALEIFFTRFHVLKEWRYGNADKCQAQGFIEIGCGRLHRAEWEPNGRLSFPQCCNLPVQGICADAMLRAIIIAHHRLSAARIRGGLIATVHDELIIECIEADAERAASILEDAMTEAFRQTFPGAPLKNLVKTGTGPTWADAKA